jgi:hypothetical protein
MSSVFCAASKGTCGDYAAFNAPCEPKSFVLINLFIYLIYDLNPIFGVCAEMRHGSVNDNDSEVVHQHPG